MLRPQWNQQQPLSHPSTPQEFDPASSSVTARLKLLGADAADELRKTVRVSLAELFGNFLKRMPAALTAASKSAPTAAQQSACLKLARSMSAGFEEWREAYLKQVDTQLIGGINTAPVVEDSSAAFANDEVVSMASIELRAETRHEKMVAELEMRFDRLRRNLHIPIHTRALAPAGLCRALQDSADVLGVPAKQRQMLFEKFEEIVVGELQQLYRAVLDALARLSVSADKAVKELPASVTNAEATLPRQARKPDAEPATGLRLDFKTVSMLENQATSATATGYSDGSLAADLLTLSSNVPLPGMTQEQNWVPLQRMKLAGDFLNAAVADPFIPNELGPQHESVRFPLVKSALTDSTLFTAVTHPLRSLVNELMLKAATSRISGSAETRRMAELLQQVLVQFDLAPDFVREAMLTAQPIPEEHIKKFFETQRQQAQERRETVINQAKRMVIQELEQSTFGRGIPDPALKFLNSAWGPLLVKRLLMHGAEHALRKEATELMETLLDLLDARDPGEPASAQWQELLKTMSEKLAADGLAAARISEALAGLEAARLTPRQ